MRALLAAICLVFVYGAAAAQTMDRSEQLARLMAALPAREAPSTLRDNPRGVALRAQLVEAHPERVSEIDAVLSRMSVCLDTEGDRLTRQLLLSAADAQLTDDEIESLITFYEGPDHHRLDAFIHQLRESRDLPSAEEREWAEQVMARPELQKFGRLVIRVGVENARSQRVEDIVHQCGDAAIAELRAEDLFD